MNDNGIDTSIEAPPYSPITPNSHNSYNIDYSPFPPMSSESSKLLKVLAADSYIDDDSVKSPDRGNDNDDDKTYYSSECDVLVHHEESVYDVNPHNYANNGCIVNETDSENYGGEEIPTFITVDVEVHEVPRERRHENGLILEREENNLDLTANAQPNITEGRPKRGRKRKSSLSREEVKYRKYNNLPYTNRKGKLILSKTFVDYKCSCTRNCSELVPEEIQEQEFMKYVNLGSYSAQVSYIIACVKEYRKKRTYKTQSETRKPKEFSRIYYLAGIKVCRDMFLNTLQVTPQKITISLKKMRNGELIQDKRGLARGGWNKCMERDVEVALGVIRRLPKYTSHYRREKTDAMYLQPGMTVEKIYNIYKDEFNALPDRHNRKCISLSKFKQLFLTKFNLRCKPLKKDTCNKCDIFAVQNNINKDEYERHLKLAEDLRNQMKKDFQRAKSENNLECLTFDLEKTLPLPRIPTNIVFYKRQLWVYNSGVHSASDDKGYCYVWVEGEAGRGAQEVGSCLLRHIDTKLPAETEHLILWSDSCGGQNRNIKLTLMLKAVLQSHENLKTITLRFLEPGHTFLPNDTDFSKIETKLKGIQRLYTVEDYINVMKECKKQKPLEVVRMKSNDFLGSRQIEKKIVNRKIFVSKQKVNWLETKEILLKKEARDSIFMRSSFEVEFEELNIKKKANRGAIDRTGLVLLWPSGREIAEKKLRDLQSLMHLIPDDAKGFYNTLKGSHNITDDLEGLGVPDFEVEYLDEEYLDF